MTRGRLDRESVSGRHLTERQAAAYVDALLHENVEVISEGHRNHVEDCFDCKAMIMEVYGVLSHEEASTHPSDLEIPPAAPEERSWFSLAAAVAIVVLALFLPSQLSETGSTPFALYPPLESLIDSRYRSLEGFDASPSPGAEVSNPVSLEWSAGGSGQPTVIISDNRGNEILSLAPKEGKATLPEALEPGLYYWKLVAQDDLLFVSKFLIPRQD